MRTTIELAPDTAAEVARLRRERGQGVSETINELIRRGLLSEREAAPYEPKTRRLGLRVDVSNVAEAIDFLEGPHGR